MDSSRKSGSVYTRSLLYKGQSRKENSLIFSKIRGQTLFYLKKLRDTKICLEYAKIKICWYNKNYKETTQAIVKTMINALLIKLSDIISDDITARTQIIAKCYKV